MSLQPFLLDLASDPLHESFGYGLYPEHLIRPALCRQPNVSAANLWPRLYARSWLPESRNHSTRPPINFNKSNIGKDGFQVSMDVQHFQPNEITVKTVDNTVVIEAKHEEKEDEFGQIFRHFMRRYVLPIEIDVNEVISTLSSDGVLTIKAPQKNKSNNSNERVIAVQRTGPAHLSVSANETDDKNTTPEDKMAE